MEIKASKQDGIIHVTLNGRLDMRNSIQAEQAFLKYAESGNDFVLDFSQVSFIGSAGIRSLLTLYRTVSEKDGSVTIENASEQVIDVLKETDFLALFNVAQDA